MGWQLAIRGKLRDVGEATGPYGCRGFYGAVKNRGFYA
jgi:hypothetical protein